MRKIIIFLFLICSSPLNFSNCAENLHGLDTNNMQKMEIKGQKLMNFLENINYYYFYLNSGYGMINNIPFSEKSSSFIIYSNYSSGKINITSLSDSMELYYSSKTVTRIQNIVDFNHIGKFIFKNDFPFYFYTNVDGKKDITFNIIFLNLPENINIEKELEIFGIVLSDNEIDNLSDDDNLLNAHDKFEGIFEHNINIGKVVIKQDVISKYLDNRYNNYLYIIINKKSGSKATFPDNIEGQFYFIPNSYVYSSIPENYLIFTNLEKDDNTAHLYTLEKDPSLNNSFQIGINTFGNKELDFKILNYQNYTDGNIDLYNDYKGYVIDKKRDIDLIYLNVSQNITNETFDKIILSVFSTNKGHMPSSNLSYAFKYNSTLFGQVSSITVVKTKVIILGFDKFTYITTNKKINFFIDLVYVEKNVYSKKITINSQIKYKSNKRMLQEESKKGECTLVETANNSNDQKRYECTIETNGEEVDNVKIDKNIKSEDDEVDFSDTEVSPMGIKHMNNIQEIGNNDIFDKKLYLLNTNSITVDNEQNEFNITGEINDNNFNYKDINLEISLTDNSIEKSENISCISTKKETNIYNLQCKTDKEISGIINNGFADLGNENLIVEIQDSDKTGINFKEKIQTIKKTNEKSSGGLSAGAIVAIVIPCVVLLIASFALGFYCFRKGQINPESKGNPQIVANHSSHSINKNV